MITIMKYFLINSLIYYNKDKNKNNECDIKTKKRKKAYAIINNDESNSIVINKKKKWYNYPKD